MCCMICIDYTKGSMTRKEASRALSEVVPKDDKELIHSFELAIQLELDEAKEIEDNK